MKELFSTIFANKKIRLAVGVLAVLLFGFIIFKLLYDTQTYTPPAVKLSSFPQASHAEIVGNDVYSFDGIVFSRTDMHTGVRTIVSKPVRYPDINTVWYAGEEGAFATFKGGFDSTPAEKYVYKYNLLGASETDVSENYLWYIDFSSGDISLVNADYSDKKFVFVNQTSQMAYLLFVRSGQEDGTSDVPNKVSQIDEYNMQTKTITKTVALSDVIDSTGIVPCSTGDFCMANTFNDQKSVFQSYSAGAVKTLLSGVGNVYSATNKSDVFLVSTPREAKKTTLLEDDVINGPYSESLYNTKTGQTSQLNMELDEVSTTTTYVDGDNVSILHPVNSTPYVSVYAKNRLGMFISKSKQSPLKATPYGQASYSQDGKFGMTSSTNSSYILFGTVNNPSFYSKSAYEAIISACMGPDDTYLYDASNSRYNISLIYGSDLQQRITTLASCLYKDPSKNSTVMTHITLISPSTGQIVSN